MQKRTAWNKGTSRIKTVRGKYDFYKGSRWSPVAGLLGSITLCLWLQFFGQSYNLSKMGIEAQEYKSPFAIPIFILSGVVDVILFPVVCVTIIPSIAWRD